MTSFNFIVQNFRWLMFGFFLTFFSAFGQTYFISLFAGEIQSEFNLTHGDWGGIYMVGTLCSAFAMFFLGGLADKFRARYLSIIMMICLAAASIAMAYNVSVVLLIGVVFALRLFGQGMASHIAMVSMGRWFVATRGRALAFASLGFSVGQAILPLVFVGLMVAIGWRMSWVVAASLTVLITPILYVLLKHERTPQSVSEENVSTGMLGEHWTRGRAVKHWLFWLILPVLLGPPAFGTAFFFHQVHLADMKGWTQLEFVSLFPVFTIVSIVVTLVSGWVIDRFKTDVLMQIYVVPLAICFILFSFVDTIFGAVIAISFYAITAGLQSTIIAAFWAEYYGTKNLGSIKSTSTVIMVFGSAIGPGLTGWLIDYGIPFTDQMIAIAVYLLIGAVLTSIGVIKAKRLITALC
jgi:MFS family permease